MYRTRKFVFKCKSDLVTVGGSVSGSTQPITESTVELENGVHEISGEFNSSWNCDGEVVPDVDITMRFVTYVHIFLLAIN